MSRRRRSLGQHFLTNRSTLEKIVRLATVSPEDKILEIGPGKGHLTRILAERGGRVVAIEKDRRLFECLVGELKDLQNLRLIAGDFLKLDLEGELKGKDWKAVANLPYSISTPAIFHLLESRSLFHSLYLMVQREVGLRLVATHGGKEYGLLSILTQIFSQNRILMRLPAGAFSPPPRVESVLVEFLISPSPRFSIKSLPTFEKVVRAAFSTRRKMLRNSLKTSLNEFTDEEIDSSLARVGIPPSERPEQVPIEGFASLSNHLYSLKELG